MTTAWDKLDSETAPTMEEIMDYVGTPLWERLCSQLEERYGQQPTFQYSSCSMQAGWNVKYRKSGRALCTLYPMEGYFYALVVIGERERAEAELAMPTLSEYTQGLYNEAQDGMAQKWLMLKVTDEDILRDVMLLVSMRAAPKRRAARRDS